MNHRVHPIGGIQIEYPLRKVEIDSLAIAEGVQQGPLVHLVATDSDGRIVSWGSHYHSRCVIFLENKVHVYLGFFKSG